VQGDVKMKITKSQLKQIIKEELEAAMLNEGIADKLKGLGQKVKGVFSKGDSKKSKKDYASPLDYAIMQKINIRNRDGSFNKEGYEEEKEFHRSEWKIQRFLYSDQSGNIPDEDSLDISAWGEIKLKSPGEIYRLVIKEGFGRVVNSAIKEILEGGIVNYETGEVFSEESAKKLKAKLEHFKELDDRGELKQKQRAAAERDKQRAANISAQDAKKAKEKAAAEFRPIEPDQSRKGADPRTWSENKD